MARQSRRPDPLPQTCNGHVAAAAHFDAMAAKARQIRDANFQPQTEDYRRLSGIADSLDQGSFGIQAWIDYYAGRFEPDDDEPTQPSKTAKGSPKKDNA